METRKTGWKPKLLMLVVSSFFIIAVLGAAELYFRMFTRINFLDNSRGLFTYNRFGNSYGNTPNFEGISFGEPFRTDENGFRIDPVTYEKPSPDVPAILVMGDSVAFGPALPESNAISGNLRTRVSGAKVYNGAAIGYDTFDQRNATLGFVNEHPEITMVFVFFCLNDVSDASAQMIRSQTPQTSEQASADAVSLPRRINDYLRSRSKLFLWLKNALVDTEMAYFKSDLLNYQKGDANVFAALEPLADLKNQLAGRGVKLKVFITPYEAQLRPGVPPEFLLPQQLVTRYFRENDIDHYDTTIDFQRAAGHAGLFLYGDPMHLSADGTKLVADAVCASTDACEKHQ